MGRELRSSRGVPENYIQQRLSMISERLTSRIYVHTITAKKSFVGKRCYDNSVLQLTVCSKSIFNKKLNDRMLTRLFDHRRPKPATPRCIRVSTIPTRTHNVCCVLQSSTNEGLLAVWLRSEKSVQRCQTQLSIGSAGRWPGPTVRFSRKWVIVSWSFWAHHVLCVSWT